MSWARRARTQARGGAAPPAGAPPLSNSTVPAAHASCRRPRTQARLGTRGCGRGMLGARWRAPRGALSPASRLAESFPAVSPAASRSAPRCSPAPGLRPPPPAASVWNPPIHLPAGESCRSRLVFALLPMGILPSLPAEGCGRKAPPSHPRGSPDSLAGRAGRQVQGWQAPTAQGSARPQSGPVLPCPSDGSPEASSSTSVGRRRARGSLCLQKGAGRAGALGLVALPLCGQPVRLRKWCLRPLGTLALHSLPPERGRCSGRTQATSAF